ncbi:IS481 family transposase [Curtobacterium flaccumfaciens]|nr:IS481 family transposase [Curtobacterium flaccumfaciens]
MTHANARLTPRGRRLIVDSFRSGWKQSHIAAAMGVSRRCVKRWLYRYELEGDAGLIDRSSRPHRSPRQAPPDVEAAVLDLRRRERLGRDEISHRTGTAARTVSRILARHGEPHLSALDPITGHVIRASKTTTVRYERATPGELAHMDVKKLGRIPEGGGWRAHGRAMGSTAQRKRTPVGYDYIHSLVDDHSRLAYSEVLPDEKGATCAAFLERGIRYFATHGIDNVQRLITDNAWAHRFSLRDLCAAHGIKQKFIKPHCPWQNGKVKRLNRTLQTEWAYRQAFTSNDERTAALRPWIEHYNHTRRHSALGGKPPISRLPPTS